MIVFDDLNKLEHLGMLGEITRFFKILEAKSANLIMVSSNEETWAKLHLEPGMKDRLRVRQLRYDHDETARMLVELIESNPEYIAQYFTSHPLFSLELIKELTKFFIGGKQMSIRRFNSVLKLVDEEEYELLVEILKNTSNLPASELVLSIRDGKPLLTQSSSRPRSTP